LGPLGGGSGGEKGNKQLCGQRVKSKVSKEIEAPHLYFCDIIRGKGW